MTRAFRTCALALLIVLAEPFIGRYWVLTGLVVWGSVAALAGALSRLLAGAQSPGSDGPDG